VTRRVWRTLCKTRRRVGPVVVRYRQTRHRIFAESWRKGKGVKFSRSEARRRSTGGSGNNVYGYVDGHERARE
jgi:hypothetical protein